MDLHQLAKLEPNRTDKQNVDHSFKGENYLHVYERYFEPIRKNVKRVLEIGVLGGHSLRLWRDYFPRAQVHGLDIDPSRKGSGNRLSIHIGDQSNEGDLNKLATYGPFDIVVDDGSHISEHIAFTFRHLFPHVKSGGFYCVEDLRCTYVGVDAGWPGMSVYQNLPASACDRGFIDGMLLSLLKTMDYCTGEVRAIHLHPMVMVIQKA